MEYGIPAAGEEFRERQPGLPERDFVYPAQCCRIGAHKTIESKGSLAHTIEQNRQHVREDGFGCDMFLVFPTPAHSKLSHSGVKNRSKEDKLLNQRHIGGYQTVRGDV